VTRKRALPLKRILYAWELGAGLGHVSRFVPLARGLDARGCEISWALTDSNPAHLLLRDRMDPLYRAPAFAGSVDGLPQDQLFYSEVLLRHGYHDTPTLIALLRDWRALLEQARPDLVVADHAPTAMLAARSLNLPCARIGTGFCCPPAADPEPPLHFWEPHDAQRGAGAVRRVLESANGALAAFGAAPLASMAQFHAVDEDFVTTYAELDHYPQRNRPRWGVVLGAESGAAPQWPDSPGPRVFAYLKGGQVQTEPLLRALRRKRCAVLAYCPGLAPATRAALETPALRFSEGPLDIEAVTAQCDLVVCGGGHGTVCAALLAGKPLLVAPEFGEQGITQYNVERLGAGLGVPLAQTTRSGALLTRLFTEPGFARAAQGFRFRHGGTTQAQIVAAIAARCVALAGRPRAARETT
jgi:UDP:flavonoid glycosyltransferase YjiC (YdhE family)